MQNAKVCYERAPSDELRKLLMPGCLLAPLIELIDRQIGDLKLDVHFRSDDCIHVYLGLTAVVKLRLRKRGGLTVTADKYYRDCARDPQFFRRVWSDADPAFGKALDDYLKHLQDKNIVHPRHTRKEGTVQLSWSRVTQPWTPFDREARLKYESLKHRDETMKTFGGVNDAFDELELIAKSAKTRWARLKKTGAKVDQLAVDSDGRLVLIELKSGSTGEYYVPFQLLQYVWEWHNALDTSPKLWEKLQTLLKARENVGLIPKLKPSLTRAKGIRAAVCFGPDKRTETVKERYLTVLDIVNKRRHLPAGVQAIETWTLNKHHEPEKL
ncbi:MAG: hypothetical protein OXE53_17065 [Deltaproteobacteria bacterium]|nr:hypothetical protein [Deltaproteobacteria bacterium]